MAFRIINPNDTSRASELATLLVNEHQQHEADSPFSIDQCPRWVWTPYTDWGSRECRDIRYEIGALLPDYTVKFRAALVEGQRGTAMHVQTRAEHEAEMAALPPRP